MQGLDEDLTPKKGFRGSPDIGPPGKAAMWASTSSRPRADVVVVQVQLELLQLRQLAERGGQGLHTLVTSVPGGRVTAQGAMWASTSSRPRADVVVVQVQLELLQLRQLAERGGQGLRALVTSVPGGRDCSSAASSCSLTLSCKSVKRQKGREGNCGLPEGTTMAISAAGFSHKISRKPRESKTRKHITASRVRSGAGWDELGLGLHGLDSDAVYRSKYPRLSLNPKRLMAGVGLRARTPSGAKREAAPPTS